MKHIIQILLIIPLFLTIGCEDEVKSELVYCSLADGYVYNFNSGVLLKFSDKTSSDIFDAESVENFEGSGMQGDTIDLGNYTGTENMPENMFLVKNSDYIKLNDQPQTFVYDSESNYCLLVAVTSYLFPDGTGEGFLPNQDNNQLKIGNEEINFTFSDNDSLKVIPNPLIVLTSSFSEIQLRNFPEGNFFIDFYLVDTEQHVARINHITPLNNSTARWDLRNQNSNQRVPSGFYIYRVGADTLSNGYLNFDTEGYFSLVIESEWKT